MRQFISLLAFFFAISTSSYGQKNDPSISNCISDAGAHNKYLKDFRIQLGKAEAPGDLRYKAHISLWKNTKYRFSLCNASGSAGRLIYNLKDETNTIVTSSYDQKTGKMYQFVDYLCPKSGVYLLNYDFAEGQQGSGVGIVSMIR